MLEFLKIILVLLFVLGGANGTLIPNGTISLDCGDQQTFTCTVPVGTALWKIVRLIGINAAGSGGGRVASENERIINPLANGAASSTITIIGFNASDDGGTIQCTYDDGLTSTVEGMAIISVGPSPPPMNVEVTGNSCAVTLQWDQPNGLKDIIPSVNCSPSSAGCAECTTSPCNITGLNPSTEYDFTVTLNSNLCGIIMNSTTATMIGLPSCPSSVVAVVSDESGPIAVTWQQPDTPPVTSTTVTYCPTSSPNCGNSMTCTSPCTISGLDPGTEYQFTVIPNNNCGSATGCTTGNMASITTPGVSRLVLLVLLILLLIPLPLYPIGVLIVQRCYYKDKSYCEVFWCCWCCGCCAEGESKRSSSTRPIPVDNYADPKEVREKKEKEEKIQYAALEFSEQAGSSGEKPIRSKEEPVQYLSVEQA